MDPRRLREETRAEHEATEALMPLGADALTRETYVHTLRVLWPLVSSWERWAEENAPEDLREMVRARRRSQFLRADLETMTGANPGVVAREICWDRVVRAAEARTNAVQQAGPEMRRATFLGAWYVMEGSTLGGRFLAKHVEAVLQLAPGQGDAYFQGHAERTGALWKELLAKLTAVPEEQGAVVVAAARQTFALFGEELRAGIPASEGLWS